MPEDNPEGEALHKPKIAGQVNREHHRWPDGSVSQRWLDRWTLPDGREVYEDYLVDGPFGKNPPKKLFDPLNTNPDDKSQQALKTEYTELAQKLKQNK